MNKNQNMGINWNRKKEHSIDGLKSKSETVDEKISELEDRSKKIIQNAKWRNKEMGNMKEASNCMEDKMRSSNKYPVGENKGNEEAEVLER